ncbi:insulin-like isoform X2 [Uloborus diversus]|uniref:insulin-like isoform X2 n=1 Tax=Uloborus diversus TaxID=327109 RepID=UPI00240A5D52|nr:insulin-like isoform X2 [Uloborus diversus]
MTMKDNFPKMTSLLCTFSILTLILATAKGSDSPLSAGFLIKRNQRYCGKALAEALHFLCEGKYYDPNENRNPTTEANEDFETNLVDRRHYDSIGIGKYGDLIDPNQRSQRQVADECCKRSCSISTLYSYCRGRRTARNVAI